MVIGLESSKHIINLQFVKTSTIKINIFHTYISSTSRVRKTIYIQQDMIFSYTLLYIQQIQSEIKMMPVLKTRVQTNVFQIDAEFVDSKLKISLRNYSDWIVYRKLYTNEDIGKQINRKVDLKQIFDCFDKAIKSKSVPQKYEFGTMISQIDMNLFKVQQNGKVIVSVNRFEKVNNQFKQIDEISNLNLIKYRDMAPNQITPIKMQIKMENTYDQFIKQLSKIKENKKVLEDKVSSLEASLAKRKSETKKLVDEKKVLQDKVNSLSAKLCQQQIERKKEIKKVGEQKKVLQEKVAELTASLKNQEIERKLGFGKEETKRKEEGKRSDLQKKLQDNLNTLEMNLAKQKEQRRAETKKLSDQKRFLEERMTSLLSFVQKEDEERREETKKIIDQKKLLQDNLKELIGRLENEESQRKAEIKRLSDETRLLQDKVIINSFTLSVPRIYQILEGPTTKNYKISKNCIQYIGNGMSQLIIKEKIPTNANFTFQIKIIKSKSKYIMIGLIDVLKQKSATTSYNSNNAVAYYCSNGNKYPGFEYEGGGVSEGETAKISVDLQAKTMKVIVDRTLRATISHSILGQPTREFLPYLQMFTPGDIVQWIQ